MPNITPRKNKAGQIISYRIRVARGYDSEGHKNSFYEKTWKSAPGMTEKQIKKEVQKVATLFEEQCKTGIIGDTTNIKLSDFIPIYLEQKKTSLSPTTYDFYNRAIETKILPALGHHKLQEIKPVHVQAFINQLCKISKQNKDGSTGEKLSNSSVKRYLTILQSIMKLAVKRRIITDNPAKSELLDIPKVIDPKIDIFTKQEAIEMLSALKNEPLQFQVFIQLAIMTSARRGELVALKFSDFDMIDNKVTIERAAIKITGEQVQIKASKDYEVREIAVTPECIQLVKALKREKETQRINLGTQWHESDWLFTQWNGEIMNPQTPTKQFSKFLNRHGFRHRKLHSLRHTSATLLLYGGVSLKQVQGRLGHGDIETTNKYLHCLSDADTEAANVLQSMLITTKINKDNLKKLKQA